MLDGLLAVVGLIMLLNIAVVFRVWKLLETTNALLMHTRHQSDVQGKMLAELQMHRHERTGVAPPGVPPIPRA